ncbi:MAG: hypothetical protein F6K09_17920, partial [Merismopedia sp. SIO2A8]|nr:hypothetical protein [Merismopedia sp. SIO2A8]
MNRAILASLCGSAIALSGVGCTYLSSQWNSLHQPAGQTHTTIRKVVLEDEPPVQAMTLERLENILQEAVDNLEGQGGIWQFDYDGVFMVLMTSDSHDRMRLV